MSSPKQLIEGFKRFRKRSFTGENAQFQNLVQYGQTPSTLIIGCCDSRVDPALILDCAPGDLFVVRNVANLVPPFENQGSFHGTSAALEFGVQNLKVQHIIVLGHAQCGGIKALLDGGVSGEDSFIAEWMGIADDAREMIDEKYSNADSAIRSRACEQQAILVSLNNLKTFSWIREGVESNCLTLHGWYFDIERGKLLGYNPENAKFEML